MSRTRCFLFSGLLITLGLPVLADTTKLVDSGTFAVGFQFHEYLDHTRLVGPHDRMQARPIRVYTWYPAKPGSTDVPLNFRRYADLADGDVWPESVAGPMSRELRFEHRPLARSLGQAGYTRLLETSMNAIEDAPASDDAHPLVVIGQGLYYESPIAFASFAEHLASHGYVVATTPLVGTRSPIVRMDVDGLETQVRDLEFVIARSREQAFVDRERLGVMGFDMGGMSGLLLSMRRRDVDAFVSLSSGILYDNPEGIPQDVHDFDPAALQIPWLHSVPHYWLKDDAPSLFTEARFSARYLLLTRNMGHVDYTGYAMIPGRAQVDGYWGASTPQVTQSHRVIRTYVRHFFDAFLKADADSITFLTRDPESMFPDSGLRMSIAEAEAAPISFEAFVAEVVATGGTEAVARLHSLAASMPSHPLLQEGYLERLVWSLRDTWGFRDRLMPVIRFRAEHFPRSIGALHMLAEAQLLTEDPDSAVHTYCRILEIEPGDRLALDRLGTPAQDACLAESSTTEDYSAADEKPH